MSSSKVLDPGDGHHATPLILRSAQRHSKQQDSPPPAEPDFKAQIEQIEQQWQARVREAHATGVREGEAAGRNRGIAEIQPAIERISRVVAEIGGMRARLRREAEADTLRLALAIARRVLRRELAVDPGALQGLLLSALQRLQLQEIARVRVHPSHAPMVRACLEREVGGGAIEVIADPSRDPGDAILETERGNLDASVESQLQEIERGLADRLTKC